MRSRTPDSHDLDEEIRGHMALSVKERIERGQSPEAARLAALKEFGKDRKSTRLNSSHSGESRMPSSA